MGRKVSGVPCFSEFLLPLCNPRKAQSMGCFMGQYEKCVSQTQTRVLEQLGLQVVLFGTVIEPLGGGALLEVVGH